MLNDHRSDHESLTATDGTLLNAFEFDHLLDRLPPPPAEWADRNRVRSVAVSQPDVAKPPAELTVALPPDSTGERATDSPVAEPPAVQAPAVSLPIVQRLSVSRFARAGLDDDRLPINIKRKRFGRR